MTTYVSTVRTRANLAQPSGNLYGREDTAFQDGIALIESYKHPALTMLQRAGTVRIDTRDVHWFEDEYRGMIDQLNYSTGINSSATGLVVDNAGMWVVGDFCRVVGTNEVALVTSVGANYIGVIRDFYQSTEGWAAKAATIADNAYLQRLATGYEGGHPTPNISNTTEAERINYARTHRTAGGVLEDVANSKQRGEQELPYQMRKKAVEHDMVIDNDFWFSKPARGDSGIYVSATGNTAPDAPGGFNHFLETYATSTRLVDQTELTESEFQDWLEVMAEKGSDQKVIFAPLQFFTALNKWQMLKLQITSGETVYGIHTLELKWGPSSRFLLVQHDALKQPAVTEYNYAFCLDFNDVFYCNFGADGPTKLVELDAVRRSTGETIKKFEYETKYSFIFQKMDHHGRLRWKTAA